MRILIVEDDEALCQNLVKILKRSGHKTDFTANGPDAISKAGGVDVLVTDVRLPQMDGLELLREVRKSNPRPEVIVMTAYGTIPAAVEAMRLGARAYLAKPFDPEELLLHLRDVDEVLRLREASRRGGRGELVGSSLVMRKVYAEIDTAASVDAPVIITGETGTGKELAARAIHELSPRHNGEFIAVNLSALPKDLVESELFGYEKGAFTSAMTKKRGRFFLADHGTLFLDEIDSLPADLQPKLLRAIETKEVWPLGSEKFEKIDVRILAATNAQLEKLVEKGAFREDLYYRLNVLNIKMPPLREHTEDIPQIARALLDRMGPSGGQSIEISPGALASLMPREWRGNVREIANVLERACALNVHSGGAHLLIDAEHLEPGPEQNHNLPFKKAKALAGEEWTKRAIRGALVRSEGNVSRAAKILKMNLNALFRLMKKYNIRRPDVDLNNGKK